MPVKRNQVTLRPFGPLTGRAQPRQLRVNDCFNICAHRCRWYVLGLRCHLIQHRRQRIGRIDQRMSLCHGRQSAPVDGRQRLHNQAQVSRERRVAAHNFLYQQGAPWQMQ